MVIFLNQLMQEKEVFLKKIFKLILLISISIYLFLNINIHVLALGSNDIIQDKIINYFSEIDQFSSNFLQTDGESFQKGSMFLNKNRIRINYNHPSKIRIVSSKKNAMYYNEDLEEVSYFNPKNTVAYTFFQIFYDKNLFDNAYFLDNENSIVISKKLLLKDDEIELIIFFEKNPLIIRKIQFKNGIELISLSIENLNFNPNINDKYFSLADPTIK